MLSRHNEKSGNNNMFFFSKKSVKVSFSEAQNVSKVHQLNELGVMILFRILYRKVS